MQNNKKKIDFIDIFVNSYLKFLPIFIVALFLYFLYWIPFGGEHIISKEGELYTMHNVELLKNIELSNTSSSVTYEFVAKKSSNRTEILLHFSSLPMSYDNTLKTQKLQKLCKFYAQTSISLYDDTNKKLIFNQKIDYNSVIFIDSNIMQVGDDIPISEHHKYHIIVDDIPAASDVNTGYAPFIIVIGQRAIATL